MSDSVRPQRWQPTRLPHPCDSPGKNTGVGCHFLLQCMKVKSESQVAQSYLTLATSWTAAYQVPPSVGFARQEYWSGLPLPSLVFMLLVLKNLPANAGDIRQAENSFFLSFFFFLAVLRGMQDLSYFDQGSESCPLHWGTSLNH